MNKFLNLTTTALFLALGVFISCGGGGTEPEPPEDPCEINAGFLVSGTATVSSVTNPSGTIVTDDWSGFTLTFTGSKDGGSYSTTVSSLADASLQNIWAASGSWSFSGSDTTCKTVDVNGGFSAVRPTTLAITSTQMTLTFDVPEADTGRTSGIPGTWVFNFTF
ncbi:MAG: hypothetical protein JXQ96_03480 [Cyclobacteriaceae bacterium]